MEFDCPLPHAPHLTLPLPHRQSLSSPLLTPLLRSKPPETAFVMDSYCTLPVMSSLPQEATQVLDTLLSPLGSYPPTQKPEGFVSSVNTTVVHRP